MYLELLSSLRKFSLKQRSFPFPVKVFLRKKKKRKEFSTIISFHFYHHHQDHQTPPSISVIRRRFYRSLFQFQTNVMSFFTNMSSTDTKTSLLLFLVLLSVSVLPTPSSSATDTFVFGGCSQLKYTQGSPYENSVNSMLTSLVNSAMFNSYNNFTIQGTNSQETLYGLFQCRGDLSTSDCGRCVAQAVSQLGTLCINSYGGALQLDGCFVKYDNTSFLGVEDKTVVVRKCGTSTFYDSDVLTRRDAVLGYLGTSDGSYKPYRTGKSGDISGVAQCVGDLSASECQDCLSEAIGRLKTECGPARWGDMFLAKCYARYSEGGNHSHGGNDNNNNDEEIEKTLAILIGLIAGVALFIIFLSFIRNLCEKGKGHK